MKKRMEIMSHKPLVRNQTSQPTPLPRETRRRRVMSRGLRREVGEGVVKRAVDEVGVEGWLSGKWFWRKMSSVWPIVQRVRQANGIVGKPILRDTAGL